MFKMLKAYILNIILVWVSAASMSLVKAQSSSTTPGDVQLPPFITVNPLPDIIYQAGQEVTLDCAATGTPTPSYQWLMNGVKLYAFPTALNSPFGQYD